MKYKYIRIELEGEPGPRQQYKVYTTRGGDLLGVIHWYIRWNCYEFLPEWGSGYSSGCLRDIADFIENHAEKEKDKP